MKPARRFVVCGALLAPMLFQGRPALSQPAPAGAGAVPNAPAAARRFYAPYIMVRSDTDLGQISDASGVKYFTLAFILDGGGCQAAWSGRTPLDREAAFAPAIANLRARGGDAIVSFGGAGGRELALGCESAEALQAQYQAVMDRYGITMLDLDIEGRTLSNAAAVDRRNAALAALQAANPRLRISYTLPVETNGLTQGGIDLLKNAVAHGVRVDVVSLMTMDYGGAADPNAMGRHAISAASAAADQLRANDIPALIGIIPMIGLNDTKPEVTTLEDARTIVEWAQSNPAIVRMSMWSAGRDAPCPAAAVVSPSCSGVPQDPYEFSKILNTFH